MPNEQNESGVFRMPESSSASGVFRKAEQSDSGVFRERTREALFNRSPIGVALVSPDWRWLKLNPALCEMLGYKEHELLGYKMAIRDVTHPGDSRIEEEELKRLSNGEITEHRMCKNLIHRRGHMIPVDIVMSRVEDPSGKHLHYLKFIQLAQPAPIDPKYLKLEGSDGDKTLRPFVPLYEFIKDHKIKIWGAVVTVVGFISASLYQHVQLQVKAEQLEKEVIERENRAEDLRREVDTMRRELEMRRLIPREDQP